MLDLINEYFTVKLSHNDEETDISEDENDDHASQREGKPHRQLIRWYTHTVAETWERFFSVFYEGIPGAQDDYDWTGGW